MPIEIDAIMMVDASIAWASLIAGTTGFTVPDDAPPTVGWNPKITHFKIGEGGWINNGTGAEPRTPVSTLRRTAGDTSALFDGDYVQDLDAIVDGDRPLNEQRYAANRRFTFEKALTAPDITHPSPGVSRFNCVLTAPEANDNGSGLSPQFWEIGLYCEHPDPLITDKLLIAYATFPMIEKTVASPETIVVTLYFLAQE